MTVTLPHITWPDTHTFLISDTCVYYLGRKGTLGRLFFIYQFVLASHQPTDTSYSSFIIPEAYMRPSQQAYQNFNPHVHPALKNKSLHMLNHSHITRYQKSKYKFSLFPSMFPLKLVHLFYQKFNNIININAPTLKVPIKTQHGITWMLSKCTCKAHSNKMCLCCI